MIEQEAIRAIGMDNAGFMNFGKSRNDQVATAVRMEARSRLLNAAAALSQVQASIVRAGPQAQERDHARIHPPAAPRSPSRSRTIFRPTSTPSRGTSRRVMQAYERVNLSPMGAAATRRHLRSGSDRDFYVASLLGFGGLVGNAMDSVSSERLCARERLRGSDSDGGPPAGWRRS